MLQRVWALRPAVSSQQRAPEARCSEPRRPCYRLKGRTEGEKSHAHVQQMPRDLNGVGAGAGAQAGAPRLQGALERPQKLLRGKSGLRCRAAGLDGRQEARGHPLSEASEPQQARVYGAPITGQRHHGRVQVNDESWDAKHRESLRAPQPTWEGAKASAWAHRACIHRHTGGSGRPQSRSSCTCLRGRGTADTGGGTNNLRITNTPVSAAQVCKGATNPNPIYIYLRP